jgi:hypothetical protein
MLQEDSLYREEKKDNGLATPTLKTLRTPLNKINSNNKLYLKLHLYLLQSLLLPWTMMSRNFLMKLAKMIWNLLLSNYNKKVKNLTN